MKRRGLFVAVVLLASIVTPVTTPVAAQNAISDELAETAKEIERLESLMAAAEGDISYWRNRISATNSRMNDVLADLVDAEAVLADLNVSINETQTAISFAELEISQKEAELAETNARIVDTHSMVVTQAVELFKRGGGHIQTVFDYQSVQHAALAVLDTIR